MSDKHQNMDTSTDESSRSASSKNTISHTDRGYGASVLQNEVNTPNASLLSALNLPCTRRGLVMASGTQIQHPNRDIDHCTNTAQPCCHQSSIDGDTASDNARSSTVFVSDAYGAVGSVSTNLENKDIDKKVSAENDQNNSMFDSAEPVDDDQDFEEKMRQLAYRRKMSVGTKRRSFKFSRAGTVDNLSEDAADLLAQEQDQSDSSDENEGEEGNDDIELPRSSSSHMENHALLPTLDDSKLNSEMDESVEKRSVGSLPDLVTEPTGAPLSPHPITSICDRDFTDILPVSSGNSSDGETERRKPNECDASSSKRTYMRSVSFHSELPTLRSSPNMRDEPGHNSSGYSEEGGKKRQSYRKSSGYGTDGSKGSQNSSTQQELDEEVFTDEHDNSSDSIHHVYLPKFVAALRLSSGFSEDCVDEHDEGPQNSQIPLLPVFEDHSSSSSEEQLTTVIDSKLMNHNLLPTMLIGLSDTPPESESKESFQASDSVSHQPGQDNVAAGLTRVLLYKRDQDEIAQTREWSPAHGNHGNTQYGSGNIQIPAFVDDMTVSAEFSSASGGVPTDTDKRCEKAAMAVESQQNIGTVDANHSDIKAKPCPKSSNGSLTDLPVKSPNQLQKVYDKINNNFHTEYFKTLMSSGLDVEEIAKEIQDFHSASSSGSGWQLVYMPSSSGTCSSSGSDVAGNAVCSPFTPCSNINTPASAAHDAVFHYMYSVEIRAEGSQLYEKGDNQRKVNITEQLVRAAQCQHDNCTDDLCRQGKKWLQQFQDFLSHGKEDTELHHQLLECLLNHADFCEEIRCTIPWCTYLTNRDESLDIKELISEMSIFGNSRMMHFLSCPGADSSFIKMTHNLPYSCVPQEQVDWNRVATLGQFGCTVLATPTSVDSNQLYWVIKKVSDNLDRQDVFTELGYTDHPYIVPHVWAVCGGDHRYICTEYITSGSLRDKLREAGTDCLTRENVVYFLHQLLDALIYLHRRFIVFLNWTTSNILVDTRFQCVRLGDFSVALMVNKEWDEDKLEDVMMTIPLEVLPPELYECTDLHLNTDMWGLGMLAYQLSKGHGVFHRCCHMEQMKLRKYVGQMNVDEIQAISDESLWRWIHLCWKKSPRERPSAVEMKNRLYDMDIEL